MSVIRRIAGHHATHMAGGFLMMGGWAVFANRAHPMPDPVVAGLVQGTLTALITLSLKSLIEALSRRFDDLRALWLPPLCAAVTSAVLLSTVHTLAGTPEVLATIAVPLTVASSYATIYCFTLWRGRRDRT